MHRREQVNRNKRYRRALTIASSDSGGGAGIQADLKTFAALGCYGTSAIAAITAQNTIGVQAIETVSPCLFKSQILSVLEDIGADAIKIGMLYSLAHMQVVVDILQNIQGIPVVFDPVMIASLGKDLMQKEALIFLIDHVFPLATIITPNLHEASQCLQKEIGTKQEMEAAAKDLIALGAQTVLIKGGHLYRTRVGFQHLGGIDAEDCLYLNGRVIWFSTTRVLTQNTHGTGCSLSSAIAAYLAHGNDLMTAVGKGKEYVTQALACGAPYLVGQGCGPLHHFHQYWE